MIHGTEWNFTNTILRTLVSGLDSQFFQIGLIFLQFILREVSPRVSPDFTENISRKSRTMYEDKLACGVDSV